MIDQPQAASFFFRKPVRPQHAVDPNRIIMRGKLEREGTYEWFKTTHGNDILVLDDKDYFALVEGQQSDLIVASDSDHQKQRTQQKGDYYLAAFQDDPEFRDQPYLFLQNKNKFNALLLPQGLPDTRNHSKIVIHTQDELDPAKVEEHVHGRGNKGSEKQYPCGGF